MSQLSAGMAGLGRAAWRHNKKETTEIIPETPDMQNIIVINWLSKKILPGSKK